jgi:hypothetical protein
MKLIHRRKRKHRTLYGKLPFGAQFLQAVDLSNTVLTKITNHAYAINWKADGSMSFSDGAVAANLAVVKVPRYLLVPHAA